MSAPTKAEELEEFINTINIPLWEVLEVAMTNIIEQSGSESMVAAEVDAVVPLLYHECYIGELGTEQWRKLAAFCVHYARSRTAAALRSVNTVGTLALQGQRNDAML